MMPLVTPEEARTLYALWQRHSSGVDVGAIQHLGTFLADEIPQDRWHAEGRQLTDRLRAVFVACEPQQSDAEREHRIRQLVLRAEFWAADEIEARTERALRDAKVVPISELQKRRDKTDALGVEKLSTILLRVQEEWEHPKPVISTPFPGLDYLMLGGFRPGELTILGARPGMGKSALALEMTRHVARHGHPVLFVSREMSGEALARRLLAQEGRLDAGTLRTGKHTDWTRVTAAINRVYGLPAYITERPRTVQAITQAVREVPSCAFVVVDYLQILSAPGVKDRRQQVETISAGLKQMALECKVPVFVLSSLSRPDSKAKQTAPGMASLRDSGALEHDADTVMLLHREPKQLHTLCTIVKNRDALVGDVDLIFRPESVAFEELMSEEEERRYGN